MTDEEDHGMLPDEAEQRHATQGKGQKQPRQATDGTDGIGQTAPRTLYPFIQGHIVLTVPMAIAIEEDDDQDHG